MNHTMFARTDLGVMAYDRDTGEWVPKQLTQIPDVPLSILPHKDDVTYGQAISQAFAKNRYDEAMK